MSDDGPNYLPAEHTRQSFEDGKRRYPQIMAALADDDPLPYLIEANERLHAEVQRLTDEHARMVDELRTERNRSKAHGDLASFYEKRVFALTAEKAVVEKWADVRNRAAIERMGAAACRLVSIQRLRSELNTLRADLATSEQTIAALKAQLQRVKEAAE